MTRFLLREITGDRRLRTELSTGSMRLGLGALRVPVAVVALALGAAAGCNCEDPPKFTPSAAYNPDKVLDFGKVAVSSEKTLKIKVTSSGRAGLRIKSTKIENSADASKWQVALPDVFTTGLAPGRTSSITVSYRPCPDAWVPGPNDANGRPTRTTRLKDNFDYNSCSAVNDSADLVTVEDGTRSGGQRIQLAGQPVQPPVAEVTCQNGVVACNQNNPTTIRCVGMTFGTVAAVQVPCDMVVEVTNRWRRDKPSGDLQVQRVEITVQDINENVTRNGEDVGFSIRDMMGNPLQIDNDHPFVVHIPDDRMVGSQRFKIRFAGLRTGTWFGSETFGMTGVRLYTTDPDRNVKDEQNRPVAGRPSGPIAGLIKFNVSGTGSAPDIQVFPTSLNFGPVEQGRTKMLDTTITNAGDADLSITSLGFFDDMSMSKFRWSVATGRNPPTVLRPNERLPVQVSYTPPVAGQDADRLVIGNNDPKTMGKVYVAITGGAVPKLRVAPSDMMYFPLVDAPPPIPPRTEPLVLSNVGYGDLKISSLEIRGPGGDPMHPSVLDFSIMECMGMPAPATAQSCDPMLTLCPPSNPACTTSARTFHIVYKNLSIFEREFVELHIRSNDPADLDHVVVLEARDIPCLFPNPVIRVDTARPCRGQPVTVTGRASTPGPTMGATVTRYEWSWLFSPSPIPDFMPPEGIQVTFTPQTSGIYLLGLDVTNSCGARSQNPQSETLNVAEVCN